MNLHFNHCEHGNFFFQHSYHYTNCAVVSTTSLFTPQHEPDTQSDTNIT